MLRDLPKTAETAASLTYVGDNATTDPELLQQIVHHKTKSLTAARGELTFPCVPSLHDRYCGQVDRLLEALGQNFSAAERTTLHDTIAKRLHEGFQASPYARLIVTYEPPDPTKGLTNGLRIRINAQVKSTEDKYQGWLQMREGALFGDRPDAKFTDVVRENYGHLDPSQVSLLDVGAGPGRNTLAPARQGYRVDAVELTPAFADSLRSLAAQENLPVTVVTGDILDPTVGIRPATYHLALISEVIPHFRSAEQVRLLLARMCDVVRSGGFVLFSAFLTTSGYEPTPTIRELAQVAWSFLLTPDELAGAMADLPLAVLSNESVFDYERQHLPPDAFPPTKWFPSWATGRDLFVANIEPPISLRWILCQRL